VYLKDFDEKLRKHNSPLTMDSATVATSGIVSTGSHGARCANSNTPDSSTQCLENRNYKLWVKTCKRTDLSVTENEAEANVVSVFQNFELKFGEYLYEFISKHPESTPFITHLLFNVGFHESEKIVQPPITIHYQAGIDNLPCMDLEFAFKINDDFSNVIEEFNYIIKRIYEMAADNKFPVYSNNKNKE
ncbi:4241_t:CDS:2, partial [Scutellospora calospora]